MRARFAARSSSVDGGDHDGGAPVSGFERLARMAAAARARESGRSDRLFHDPLAAALAGSDGEPALAALLATLPGGDEVQSPLGVRTRFFDELIARALELPSLRQVVLLGAGMDARAFRLPWPDGARLFELDHPSVLEAKAAALSAAGAQPRCERVAVGAALARPWAAALQSAGFDAARPSLWLLEGLLVYLAPEEVHAMLTQVAALAASGSVLGVDLVAAATLAQPEVAPALDRFARDGTPWRFGTDEPERLLALYGWSARALQVRDVAARYGRALRPAASPSMPGGVRAWLVAGWRR
jgi:methyltransferase (TIGR00027 family)